MKKRAKITFEKATEMFIEQGRSDIELCEDGWNGWSNKSKFYDKIIKEYFILEPRFVYQRKTVHPKRNKTTGMVTLEVALYRFSEQGRTDIELCKDNFNGWKKKSKFYDILEIEETHNWVDLRYGTGYHLLNKKFIKKHDTLGWKWTDCRETFNRLKCRANMDDRKLTQQQHVYELGWFKIYDAGQRLYVKYLKQYHHGNIRRFRH